MASILESLAKVFGARPKNEGEAALLMVIARLSTRQKQQITSDMATIRAALTVAAIAEPDSKQVQDAVKIVEDIIVAAS